MEHLLVDDHGRPCRAGHHHLLLVPQEAVVGICVDVHGQVRARHHLERRALRSQVVQVVEHAHQHRGAGQAAEDPRAVRLRVGVDGDAGVAGLAELVGDGDEQHLVPEQPLQERDRGRQRDRLERGRQIVAEQVVRRLLVRGVVGGGERHLGHLRADDADLLRREEIGQDQVPLQLQVADALAGGQGAPVVDAGPPGGRDLGALVGVAGVHDVLNRPRPIRLRASGSRTDAAVAESARRPAPARCRCRVRRGPAGSRRGRSAAV